MIELEVVDEAGAGVTAEGLRGLVVETLAAAGVEDGDVAVHFVAPQRMRALNAEHRGVDAPTDVLAFPVDEASAVAGPRLLGDVFVCPLEAQDDPEEVVIHGLLHLAGLDHEVDGGAMLALQAELHERLAGRAGGRR